MSIKSAFEEGADRYKVNVMTDLMVEHYDLNPVQEENVKNYFSEVFMEQVPTEEVTRPPVYESVSTISEVDGSVSTKNYVSVADDEGSYHKVDTTKASKDLSPEQYGAFAVNLARIAAGDVRSAGEGDLFAKIKGGFQPFIDRMKKAGAGGVIFVGIGVLGLGGLVYAMGRKRKKA